MLKVATLIINGSALYMKTDYEHISEKPQSHHFVTSRKVPKNFTMELKHLSFDDWMTAEFYKEQTDIYLDSAYVLTD